jgi:hypothetical protein
MTIEYRSRIPTGPLSISSGWVHDEIGLRAFARQEGYGAFQFVSIREIRVSVPQKIWKKACHQFQNSLNAGELQKRKGVDALLAF